MDRRQAREALSRKPKGAVVSTFYSPDLLYRDGTFVPGLGLLVNHLGQIERITTLQGAGDAEVIKLPRKALLPGFVNAHSHSFQRLIRGRSESRSLSGEDFWSWRGTMYHAAAQLTPEDVYDVARMAFLEMLLAGTTTVGEFHYLHTDPSGSPYTDPNLLSKRVIDAAQSVGIRIVLLRTAYLRSGYELPHDPGQTRFFETTDQFLRNMESLLTAFPVASSQVRFGVAPHSIRAVPLQALKQIAEWTSSKRLPLHMHVAEQLAENAACLREYGYTPVQLLSRNGILDERFTAVHAIHLRPTEFSQLAEARATICSCPTTERNLGDGIFAADQAMASGISIALGSDSQAQIDPLEDARELDYHLRLRDQQRILLDQIGNEPIAKRLFACATQNGARALDVNTGDFIVGAHADAFTVDLDNLSIAGHSPDDLLSILVFSLNSSAIQDVLVNGQWTLRNRHHPLHEEIVARYKQVHQRVWHGSPLEAPR
jgi:formimidoylglutamate deiminase